MKVILALVAAASAQVPNASFGRCTLSAAGPSQGSCTATTDQCCYQYNADAAGLPVAMASWAGASYLCMDKVTFDASILATGTTKLTHPDGTANEYMSNTSQVIDCNT